MNKASVASIVVPLVAAAVGLVVFFLLGRTLTVSVGGQDLPVELVTSTLGLIVGYFIGARLAPRPEPAAVQPEPVPAPAPAAVQETVQEPSSS